MTWPFLNDRSSASVPLKSYSATALAPPLNLPTLGVFVKPPLLPVPDDDRATQPPDTDCFCQQQQHAATHQQQHTVNKPPKRKPHNTQHTPYLDVSLGKVAALAVALAEPPNTHATTHNISNNSS